MKYVLVDRYLELVPGEHATAVKNVPLGEDYHAAPCLEPAYPPSLLMETMAQAAGMLIAVTFDFQRKTVFAKIETAEFPSSALPGDSIQVQAGFLERLGGHCRMQVTSSVDERTVGRMTGLFTALELEKNEGHAFDTPEFARARESALKCLGVRELLERAREAQGPEAEGGS